MKTATVPRNTQNSINDLDTPMKSALHENIIGASYLRWQAREPSDLCEPFQTLEVENLVRAESVSLEARPHPLCLRIIK